MLSTGAAALQTELPGRTQAVETSEVRPQVTGLIKARLFTEGDLVRAGQPLYQIDPALYRAASSQAQSQLASAEAAVTSAKAKAERYADLVKINAVSRQEADDAKAAYDQAAAAIQQGRAAVETARINLGYTQVRAPISGRIGRSAVTPGALVSAQQAAALATIQRTDVIYVDLAQSADQVLALKRSLQAGQLSRPDVEVRLKLGDGTLYETAGRLQFTDVTVDQNTGAVTLRAIFPNPKGLLLPGLFVRAIVNQGVQPDALLAPQRGISRDDRGQATALVVNGKNEVEQRVLTGVRASGQTWIVGGGLKAGDRLIVEGLQSVRPGARVRPVPAGSAPKGP